MSLRALRPLRLLAVLLALGAPTAAALPAAEFSTPAQASGDTAIEGLQWALLVLAPSSAARFDLAVRPTSTTNHTAVVEDVHHDRAISSTDSQPVPGLPQELAGELRAAMAFGDAWSSLYVEAESIELLAAGAASVLERTDGQLRPHDHLPKRPVPSTTYRSDLPAPRGLSWAIESSHPSEGVQVTLQAQGVRRLEWHNATLQCASDLCLDGARDHGTSAPLPGGHVGVRTVSMRELASSAGTLQGAGRAWAVATGGSPLAARIDGWLRLPEAHVRGDCADGPCPDPGGRTLQVQGQVELQGLAPRDGTARGVSSQISVGTAAARIDESPAPGLATGPAWAAAAIAGAGLAIAAWWKALLGLFARSNRPVLDNPKAKQIHETVLARPGISFEDLRRATGIGHGTMQYHLKRLLGAGLLAAYAYGKRVRYYENHGRHGQDWMAHAAYHNPKLRQLHQWLVGHPGATQAAILREAASWGWGRSTTQKFLKQLEAAGLLVRERTPVATAYLALRPEGRPVAAA